MGARRGLKRILYRSLEELKATARIARRTSVKNAILTFRTKVDIQRMNHNGFQEPPAIRKRLLKKHEVMLSFFEKEYAPFVEQYDFNRPIPDDDPSLHDRIWVCWWQGLDHAPELVKACIDSVQRNAGDRKVTVITQENYKQYANIPEWIEEKHKAGIISRTHFSDILRLSLLAEHGGMWLDATFYCSQTNLSAYYDLPFWTIKRPDYLHVSVAAGQFATYSLGCSLENRWVFATIRDFLVYYWKQNDILIDYLVLDYLFVLAQRSDSRIADKFNSVKPNNPNCDVLVEALKMPFNKEQWETMKRDTGLFKLTWKQDFSLESNGQETFYAKLLKGEL